MGVAHVADVLVGAGTKRIRDKGHDGLTTYGVGKELDRNAWRTVATELLRLGLVRLSDDGFATVGLTPAGRDVLVKRTPVTLTRLADARPAAAPRAAAPSRGGDRPRRRGDDGPCDEALFARLRTLRKTLAEEKGVPAYVVFADTALRDMARRLPADEESFLEVNGVGEAKLRNFGAAFLAEIAAHLAEKNRAAAQ